MSSILIVDQIRDLSRNIAATVALFPACASMVDEDLKLADPYCHVVDAVRALGANCDPMALIHRLEARHPESERGFWRGLVLASDGVGGTQQDLPPRVLSLRKLQACASAYTALQAAQTAAGAGDEVEGEKHARAAAQALAGWVGEAGVTDSADDAMAAMSRRLDAGDDEAFLPTRFRALDTMVGPVFAPGRLVVLAARPGVGKTAFALNVATNVARDGHVLYWCGEMSGGELWNRALCAESRIPLSLVGKTTLSDIDTDRRRVAMGRVASLHMHVNTSAGMTVAKLDAMVRQATTAKRKPVLVVADYMQRMGAPGSRSREEEVGGIARGLKELAKEHDLCVLALAQMNREVEKRVSGRPKLSDLRESGQIEQEADAIIFPDRDTAFETDMPWPRDARLFIEKFRHGKSGEVLPMTWHGPFQTWRDK